MRGISREAPAYWQAGLCYHLSPHWFHSWCTTGKINTKKQDFTSDFISSSNFTQISGLVTKTEKTDGRHFPQVRLAHFRVMRAVIFHWSRTWAGLHMGIDSPALNSPESFLRQSGKNQDQPHKVVGPNSPLVNAKPVPTMRAGSLPKVGSFGNCSNGKNC